MKQGLRLGLFGVAAVGAIVAAEPAAAQEQTQQYHLEEQSLGDALRAVGRVSGREVMFRSDIVEGKRSSSLDGTYTASQAIERLLSGSGLFAVARDGGFLIRGRSEAAGAEVSEGTPADGDIVVTGTHIRSGGPTSTVISTSRRQMESVGISDLGEFIRILPQNFTGGQNPGLVGGGNQGGNENLNASSALNLRGLGPDATLTLINGHRVAYDGAAQGVDISAIPLAAVERVEVVPDGASALYGSDAVGGVANIILRRDLNGVEIAGRLAGTTDGGGWEQQYDLVAGRRWSSGNVLFAGNFSKSTAILAGQRSVTKSLASEASLFPYQRQYAFVLNGSQDISDRITLLLDGQYSHRNSEQAIASTTTSGPAINGVVSRPVVETYSISPTLKFNSGGGWQFSLGGTIGQSDTEVPSTSSSGGTVVTRTLVKYGNRLRIMEANAEGPIVTLPGGDVRLAVGAGYRWMSFKANATVNLPTVTITALNASPRQNVLYSYGELSVPILAPANHVSMVDTLRLSLALRYEDYKGVDQVASPKIGLLYKPVPDLSLQASWGKSFKAPTFYQRFRGFQTILYPASNFGGNPAQTALYISGGNPGLQPEKAETWTASAIVEPRSIEGLRLELGYFDINYRDRVVSPITSTLGLFSNPLYQHLIDYTPTADQMNSAIAGSIFGLQNFSTLPYDPTTVAAVVYANLQNSAMLRARGVDLNAQYHFQPSERDSVTLSGAASYLDSKRQLIVGQPSVGVSGVIFTPPKWRARLSGTWEHENVTLATTASYIGGTLDNRVQPYVRVGSFFSIDLNLQIRSGEESGPLAGTELAISIMNLANEKPAIIRNSSVTDPTYDSVNYSVIGRRIGLTLTKRL